MRDLTSLDDFRVRTRELLDLYGYFGDATGGAFELPHSPTGATLRVIASAADGWDHVSVSLRNRTPNWAEMDFIKRRFFEPHEIAMQLHVAETDHVNTHPNCLHLWRPHREPIPTPPKVFV